MVSYIVSNKRDRNSFFHHSDVLD